MSVRGLRTRRTPRPAGSRLETRAAVGGPHGVVDFVRRPAAQCRMRPAPALYHSPNKTQFPQEAFAAVGHQQQTRASVFQSQDESFHHGDAAVLADRPVARRFDARALTPVAKALAVELGTTVADEVLRRASRPWRSFGPGMCGPPRRSVALRTPRSPSRAARNGLWPRPPTSRTASIAARRTAATSSKSRPR